MAGHHALVEDDAALGIDAGGDIGRRHLARLRAQLVRVLRQCQRMQVDDAEDAVVVALQRDPVSDGAEIIAEMQIAGGLDAREDAVHGAVVIAAAAAMVKPLRGAADASSRASRRRRTGPPARRSPRARRLRAPRARRAGPPAARRARYGARIRAAAAA